VLVLLHCNSRSSRLPFYQSPPGVTVVSTLLTSLLLLLLLLNACGCCCRADAAALHEAQQAALQLGLSQQELQAAGLRCALFEA
jgi:hypothetical protein